MKHRIFVSFIFLECLVLLIFFTFSVFSVERKQDELLSKRALVRELMLTDFAIWTEARYTRHPSQADIFTPFQDYPASIEHFPAGSMIAPPEHIRGNKEIKFSKQ